MIQDITPHQYNITYHNLKAEENSILLIFQGSGILCHTDRNGIVYPTVKEIEEILPTVYEMAGFLFRIDNTNYFHIYEETIFSFGKWRYLSKENLRNVRPIWKAYAGITGFQLHKWYRENRFCGRCGTKMHHHIWERAMECPDCGAVIYPKISPSVIVAVTNGDQILLTKYSKNHSSYRKYALVAGYVEVGESLEDTVRREVMEEVGLRVKNIRYYKSQPWSFTDALLVGFFCEVDGDPCITMDKEELSVAEWIDKDHIPKERSEASISLTGEMIEAFRDGYSTMHEKADENSRR